jgi:hypothetical protein
MLRMIITMLYEPAPDGAVQLAIICCQRALADSNLISFGCPTSSLCSLGWKLGLNYVQI